MMARWVKTALVIASSRHSTIVHLFAENAAIMAWPDPKGGGGAWVRAPPENHQNIGFLSNTGPDSLQNYKATKPASILGHYRQVSLAGR